ncbi:hypothetical protein [Georgenia sp. AZ-5]|uniref:hypothetical protein n=1 Tax=Georgenia sp. AZ-5 TaxID=3367526 RepID=UPI00375480F9
MVVGLTALLAGCSPTGPPASPTATPAPSPSATATGEAEPLEELAGQEQADAHVPPAWDAPARADAEARAAEFMRAFARPDLPAEEWLDGLRPLMAPEARDYYAAVDPRQVPASAVTGPATAQETGSAYLATVVVGTDAGDYAVTLTRTADGEPWLVQRAEPAGG